jgi:glucose/arabinose dehydrogenase
MKFIQYTLTACLMLSLSYTNAQDITIGNTTLTEREIAVDAVYTPWEIQWGPDDHLWVTERQGRVLRIDPVTGLATEILDYLDVIDYDFAVEPGMLGMTFHPDFSATPLVYIMYTTQGGGYSNNLASFEWDGTELVNPTVILDDLHAGGIHSGSRIITTQDGKLLLTLGDGGDGGSSSQNMNSNGGKILRVNLDGTIPSDNPFPNSYVYSSGHRNPQGLLQAPNGTIYSSEHGQSAQDELNIIEPGLNYGWPTVEGYCDDYPSAFEPNDCEEEGFTEPIFEVRPCGAISDLVYYDHPAIPEFENTLLLCVMNGFFSSSPSHHRGLFLLELNEDGTQLESTFDQSNSSDEIILNDKGRVRDICVNPNNGAIYIAVNGTSYYNNGPNKIYEYKNESFTSVNESVITQSLNIYPNPSAGDVKFQVSEHLLGGTYEVISYDGKKVLEGSISSTNFEIKDGALNSGSYYVVVRGDLGSISRTFIVQ